MMASLANPIVRPQQSVARQRAIVDFLRTVVLHPFDTSERIHAVFLDGERAILGDASLGQGPSNSLSVRMREIFGRALSLEARGMVLAHNHPSGNCRPSRYDIESTSRLNVIAKALDIELVDHLIFTHAAVYSMRAGGDL